jgi:[protein-PII] uridylyltransferase
MEASAAKRLRPRPHDPPTLELDRYREFLKIESHRLRMHHRAGGGGRENCQARAAMMDVLLRHLVEAVASSGPGGKPAAPFRFAVVALGGYGRGELNPHSDVDLMFLHTTDGTLSARGRSHPALDALTQGVLYRLWDLGLKVGHSSRTVEDCLQECGRDMRSRTSLIEARCVAGDAELFRRMETLVLAKCVRGCEDGYLAARLEDQEARRAKFGGSATMQEPNIKNGCGGLRDYQNLLWMAFFKYRTRTLEDLEARELINAPERHKLEKAYDFLLRVRNGLHYEVNRPADAVTKDLQPRVARSLGFTERSPRQRLERFMREVYTHMRNIFLITRTLERRLALLPNPQRRLPSLSALFRQGRQRVQQRLVDGFRIVDGEICAASPRVFRDQPRRLLRVFFHAQQRGLKLHPDLVHLISNQLTLVGREFLHDPHGHETFLAILSQRGNVAPILRLMHESGLLGRYLPEFGRLTCLVQHEFFHQYTADEHTLVCLEHLDRIWEATEPPHHGYTEIFQGLERPFVLYLALLLHDAGKADPTARHAETGGQMALGVARRLGLDTATTDALQRLIEHHLVMTSVSQRRDLDDPAVIRGFAAQMRDLETLKMLTLHTVADALGTGDRLWNDFKDALLTRLYRKTHEHMAGGGELRRADEQHRELLAAEVRRLGPAGVSEEELEAHFTHLPPRYYQVHTAREIVTDLTLTHQFMHRQVVAEESAFAPVLHWHNEPDRGCTTVKVCTWDRPGLFSKLTGALTAAGLNILSAQIFTRRDGLVLDTFSVADVQTGLPTRKEEREKCERLLRDALVHGLDLAPMIAPRQVFAPLYQSVEGEHIPTVIRFDNEASESRTVLDLETEDHIGLLYAVSRTLSELALDISLAKICTEKGAAVDSFYVSEADGSRILLPERQGQIGRALRATIARLEATSAA